MAFMLSKKEYKIITGMLNIFTCNYVYISVFKEIQNRGRIKEIQLSVLVSDFL